MARRRKNHGQATPVGQLAEQALASLIPAGQLRLARIQLAWIEAVPAHLRPMAAPAALDGDGVIVHVVDNQWLHELTYLRADLLARLRERCRGMSISGLRMRVGPVPQMPAPTPDPEPDFGPALALQPPPDTLEAIAEIQDAHLRHAIATARQSLTGLGRR